MSDAVPPIAAARNPRVVTTVKLSVSAWTWLRQMALDRAERDGGKPSASAVLEELIREESDRRGGFNQVD